MSRFIGIVSAYAYAVSQGYTGTEEEYAELMASYATVAEEAAESAESAQASATTASGAASTATTKASEASASAQTASTKASEASTSATQAGASATSASQSASTATTKASEASASASTAGSKASEASTSASTASSKASEASASATAASASEANASASATAAAQSASDAADSASDAQTAAANAHIEKAFPTDTASGSIVTFADGADDIPMKSVKVAIEPVQSGSGDPSPTNVRPISGWTGVQVSHSGADRTNPTVHSITFPTEAGTVYGGELDVTNGTLTVDRAMVTYDGSENWGTALASGENAYRIHLDTLPQGIKIPASSNEVADVVTNILPANSADNTWFKHDGISVQDAYEWRIYCSQYNTSDITPWKEFLANNHLTVCCKLATPTTYNLTPTEIKSLLGDNNVWADAGDTEVTYRADTKLYIEKKMAGTDIPMVADSNIVSGSYFMVGDNLYKATANIASGASVIVGTNATAKTMAEALNEINA